MPSRIKRVSIYDMDGTIVCSLHRYRTIKDDTGKVRIDLRYWRDNEHKADKDSLLPLAEQYKADLEDHNCYVIIATARVLNDTDNCFIRDKLGAPDHIISRPAGDTTSGSLLKIQGLYRFFNLPAFRSAQFTFYEDNLEYLRTVCQRFKIRGVYVPSLQGH
jgi:hypothetical protein